MTQLSIPSPVPQGPDRLSPPEKATRERRGRDSRSRTPLRERAENAAREIHPNATRITANVAHQDGPVVDVFTPRGNVSYRYVGF